MGQVKCLHEDCKYSAQHVGQLQTHIKTSHSSSNIKTDLYPCPHCEHKATRTYSIKTHIKSVHGPFKRSFPCSQCDYKTKESVKLETHIKSVHEGQTFKCPHCDKRYKHKSHIKEHINVVHEGKGKLLPCSFCDYKATRVSIPRKLEVSNIRYQCRKCELSLKSQNSSEAH